MSIGHERILYPKLKTSKPLLLPEVFRGKVFVARRLLFDVDLVMQNPVLLSFRAFYCVVALAGIGIATVQAQSLTVLPSGFQPSAINNSGQIVGTQSNHAALYSAGSLTDLGTLGGASSSGGGINNLGQMTGSSGSAFIYSGGVMSSIGTLGGTSAGGSAINDLGQVAGGSGTSGNGPTHAFLYSSGTMTDLGTFGGGFSNANAIDSAGRVAGGAQTSNGDLHAFLYSGGIMNDLGTLGGSASLAFGINDLGTVVGASGTASGHGSSFLYSGGTMIDIGGLGGNESQAHDINNLGQIVGFSSLAGQGTFRAYFYSGGVMQDLNTLYASFLSDGTTPGFIELDTATSINDSGQITGLGGYFTGSTLELRGYVIDPRASHSVGDSGSSFALIGLSLFAIIAVRRRGILRAVVE